MIKIVNLHIRTIEFKPGHLILHVIYARVIQHN